MSALQIIAKAQRLKKLREAMRRQPITESAPVVKTDERLSHRAFAESPKFCGLTLSPLVAAIMDASEGLRVTTLDDRACEEFFGCPCDALPHEVRRTIGVRAGGRGGKTSRLVATKAIHAAWTVPLPTLGAGEYASAIIVAPSLKLARQALSFVRGYIEASDTLRAALIDEPTKDSIELRRPDGKPVRIEILAASKGGKAVRARTLVFAALDEACFFADEQSGVINDAEIWRALIQRVVPGGQLWVVSTPWLADTGLLEALISKNWGTHQAALVATAPTRQLNPTWDPTGEIERDLREQDPDAADREILAIPMAGGSGAFFDPAAIKQCVDADRLDVVETPAGAIVAFGSDLAFVRDSSTLAGVGRTGESYELLVLKEKRPEKGKPLKPSEVIADFALTIKDYGANDFAADGHYRETAREHLDEEELNFVDIPSGREGKAEMYLFAKKIIHEKRLAIPNHARLLSQLRAVVSKPVPGGGFVITSPRKAGGVGQAGGGHGDLVSALVNALWNASLAEVQEPIGRSRVHTHEDPTAY